MRRTPSDLKTDVFARFFGKFALPEKEEGFDDVRYEWASAAGSKTYLQEGDCTVCQLQRFNGISGSVPFWADFREDKYVNPAPVF